MRRVLYDIFEYLLLFGVILLCVLGISGTLLAGDWLVVYGPFWLHTTNSEGQLELASGVKGVRAVLIIFHVLWCIGTLAWLSRSDNN